MTEKSNSSTQRVGGHGQALPAVVDRDAFQAELDGLRVREKAHTREGDALAASRRRLPMAEVDSTIELSGADGPVTLAEAFDGRRRKRALELARDTNAATLVIEKNFAGRWLTEVLEQAMRESGIRLAYSTVNAKQGKRTRAEPSAALYEQGRVHHVGRDHERLEEQLVTWTGGPGERSPDRLDALVWAIEHLRLNYGGGAGASNGPAIPWKDASGEPQWSPDLVAAGYRPWPGHDAPRVPGVPGGAVPWQ